MSKFNSIILIFSEESDISTNSVCDWLFYLNKDFLRINKNELLQLNTFSNINGNIDLKFSIQNTMYSISQFKSIWFRRGGIDFFDNLNGEILNLNLLYEIPQIKKYLADEMAYFIRYCHDFLSSKATTHGNVNKKNLNKLQVLDIAKKQFLITPDFLVTTSKKEAICFFNECDGKVISKSIKENINYSTDNETIFHTNKVIKLNDFDFFDDNFQLTLFQRYFDKEFEIRTFYFNEEFYSIAIFSQLDNQTKEDYRNYNESKQTRCIPFILPEDLKIKLKKVFNEIGINTGSVDLIYSKNEEFIFLEINPVGQFGIVSRATNFQIEKKIALTL